MTDAPAYVLGRRLTDDQRYVAEEIASAMSFGHEEGCQVWWEDADGCSCQLSAAIGEALLDFRLVDFARELGWDPATHRGDRVIRSAFNPVPIAADEGVSEALALYDEIGGLWRQFRDVTRHGNPLGMTFARYVAERMGPPQIVSASGTGPVAPSKLGSTDG